MFPWVKMTPLGLEVVPLVNRISHGSSGDRSLGTSSSVPSAATSSENSGQPMASSPPSLRATMMPWSSLPPAWMAS